MNYMKKYILTFAIPFSYEVRIGDEDCKVEYTTG